MQILIHTQSLGRQIGDHRLSRVCRGYVQMGPRSSLQGTPAETEPGSVRPVPGESSSVCRMDRLKGAAGAVAVLDRCDAGRKSESSHLHPRICSDHRRG